MNWVNHLIPLSKKKKKKIAIVIGINANTTLLVKVITLPC